MGLVWFLDSAAKVSELVEGGDTTQDTFTSTTPLTNPDTKVMISNAAPFSSDEPPVKELSQYGQLVSPTRTVWSWKLNHLVGNDDWKPQRDTWTRPLDPSTEGPRAWTE